MSNSRRPKAWPATVVFSPSEQAGEVAEACYDFVRDTRACPTEAVADLRAMLAWELTRRSPGRIRLGHLELMLMMLAAVLHEPQPWVTSTAYAAEQERRAELGEHFTEESTLRAAYAGRWERVVGTAARFLKGTGSDRTKSRLTANNVPHGPYEPLGILAALVRARDDLGTWPSEWEFAEYGAVKRLLANEDPRLPVPEHFRRAYGGYKTALRLARHYWDEGFQTPGSLHKLAEEHSR